MRNYGQATVVFDGYGEGPSIKDNTYLGRGKNLHPVISFTAETEFSGKKEEFLSHDKNKTDIISLKGDVMSFSHQVMQMLISLGNC